MQLGECSRSLVWLHVHGDIPAKPRLRIQTKAEDEAIHLHSVGRQLLQAQSSALQGESLRLGTGLREF